MIEMLRARVLCALGLGCALASPAACSKTDDDASAVDQEKKPKKQTKPVEPTPPLAKTWVPDAQKYQLGGGCPMGWFCATRPEILDRDDASTSALAACGTGAKIPEGIVEGFEGRRASFAEAVSERVRNDEKDACCYSFMRGPCGKGRPMAHEGSLVLASEIERVDWADVDTAAIAADVRAIASEQDVGALVVHLRRVAILEHASVAAFARVSLELVTLGAPADLVEGAHRAALDEIRHARLCWSLLAALEGRSRGPSPMAIPSFATDDRAQILLSTIVDGCVGETVGSLVFHEAARLCRVPSLAAMYRSIAEEEAEHALLAFRIAELVADGRDLPSIAASARFEAETRVHREALGILGPEAQRAIHEQALARIILPALAALSRGGSTLQEERRA